MDQLSQGLLHLAGDARIEQHYGTFVRRLERTPDGPWRLLAADGSLLTQADWLVLTGTLLAHPRSQLLLGWDDVPLARVAAGLSDLQLDHVLACLAGIRFEARTNLMLVFEPQQAAVWVKPCSSAIGAPPAGLSVRMLESWGGATRSA